MPTEALRPSRGSKLRPRCRSPRPIRAPPTRQTMSEGRARPSVSRGESGGSKRIPLAASSRPKHLSQWKVGAVDRARAAQRLLFLTVLCRPVKLVIGWPAVQYSARRSRPPLARLLTHDPGSVVDPRTAFFFAFPRLFFDPTPDRFSPSHPDVPADAEWPECRRLPPARQ